MLDLKKTNILEDQLILICHLAVLKFHICRFSERVYGYYGGNLVNSIDAGSDEIRSVLGGATPLI